MDSTEDGAVQVGFWAVLLGSLFALAPALYPGYWQSLEGFVPIFNATRSAPIASIATSPDLWRGTGSAAFLLSQPLVALGLSPVQAVRAGFVVCLLFGSLSIYVWLRPRLGDRAAGLGGVLYALLPTVLATVYVRGSLSDAWVVALLPMTLAGIAIYVENRSASAVGIIVISMLWLWRTQAGLALFSTAVLLLYVLVVERDRWAALIVFVSGGAGLASLIPLWHISSTTPVEFREHFVYLYQFFENGWTVAPSISGWQDAYPFQIGFAAPIFGLVALWLWWVQKRVRQDHNLTRFLGFCALMVLLLLALCMNFSAPLWQISGAERLLTYPWQLMILAAPFLVALAGSLPALNQNLHERSYWITLVAMAILSSTPYLTTAFTGFEPLGQPVAVFGENQDYLLLEATLTEDVAENHAQLDVTWQTLRPLAIDYNVFFQAFSVDGDELAPIGQLDIQPKAGERPASTWQIGEIITDTYQLELNPNVPTDQRRYFFGYYDWRDGVRVPVHDQFGRDSDRVVFDGQ